MAESQPTKPKPAISTYTVIYEVIGDREKHDEWWRMIRRDLPPGITIIATASFDALARLDDAEECAW